MTINALLPVSFFAYMVIQFVASLWMFIKFRKVLIQIEKNELLRDFFISIVFIIFCIGLYKYVTLQWTLGTPKFVIGILVAFGVFQFRSQILKVDPEMGIMNREVAMYDWYLTRFSGGISILNAIYCLVVNFLI